jgi:hypothetical protein
MSVTPSTILQPAPGFEALLQSDEHYAVIALDERDFEPHSRRELSISLTLAFLLTADPRLLEVDKRSFQYFSRERSFARLASTIQPRGRLAGPFGRD